MSEAGPAGNRPRIGPEVVAGRLPRRGQIGGRSGLALLGLLAAALLVVAAVLDRAVVHALVFHLRGYLDLTFLYWPWSKLLHAAGAGALYDPAALSAFQHRLDPGFPEYAPFAYPPSFLLVIWPLALMSRIDAYLLWVGGTFALFVWACWHRAWGGRIAFFAAVAPPTVANLLYAQSGFLIGALLIGGCRLCARRPVLAGVLFGLLSVKPQFGLLVPVALIAAGAWRAAVAATLTALALVAASGAAFGWPVWLGLPQALLGLSRFVGASANLDHFSPTVAAGARLLGAGGTVAHAAQAVAALIAAACVWGAFRGGFTRRAIAVLLIATLLATPYAFAYDLPMVGYAVLLFVLDRTEAGAGFAIPELAVLLLALSAPLLMIFPPLALPWGSLASVLFLALILRRWQGSAVRGDGQPGAGTLRGFSHSW